ncbi:MAG: hypothetical protein PHH54_02600 [Candidatus Nanoarchaeia archaeon]|nr:hypothetical protein [Candidatus Nanoarchaeia archaeon]MDD5740851.1 hypothetical protein [Candidatus Nanoarchaeia archaeon]
MVKKKNKVVFTNLFEKVEPSQIPSVKITREPYKEKKFDVEVRYVKEDSSPKEKILPEIRNPDWFNIYEKIKDEKKNKSSSQDAYEKRIS